MAVVRTPDGHGRVELSTFHTPVTASTAPRAPINTPGIPRLTFAVDDVLDRLRAHDAELVGEVAQYGDIYRYCQVRGPTASSSGWSGSSAEPHPGHRQHRVTAAARWTATPACDEATC